MDEETMTTIPEPSSTSDSTPPETPDPPFESEHSDSVTVVSVDELIDRLVQSTESDEEVLEEPPEEILEEPFLEPEPIEVVGMDKLLEYVETTQQTLDHPALTTSFQDYTVTEGLLLLLLLAVFAAACVKIMKGGFQWLRW